MKVKLTLPLFRFDLTVFVGQDSFHAYKKAMIKTYGEEVEFPEHSLAQHYGSFMWLSRPELVFLVHESVHFADCVLDGAGIKDTSGEMRAYIVQWCVDAIWPRINKV